MAMLSTIGGGNTATVLSLLLCCCCCLTTITTAVDSNQHEQNLIPPLLIVDDHVSGANQSSYRVLRVTARTEAQLTVLQQLAAHDDDYEIDFWNNPRAVGVSADVMVPPRVDLERMLTQHDIEFIVTIADVYKLLQDRNLKKKIRKSFGPRLADDRSRNRPKYNLYEYGGYEDMTKYMEALERKYPTLARTREIGRTHQRRPIITLKLGNPVDNEDKPAIWIDGGIHAREWAAPHTAVYFMHHLSSRYGRDEEITHLLDSVNIFITPVINPDGYEYTRSSLQPKIRLWRKNRSPSECNVDRWGRKRCCMGVDLNRNFQFFWGQSGSSDHPCSEIYAGKTPFSEPESQAVRDALMSPPLRGKVDAFFTLHTYSQIWVHPYGHRVKDYPSDKDELKDLGDLAAKALKSVYGTEYVVGSGADTLYPAAGGSDDWAKAVAGVKYVYLLELRPDERQWDGFILDESELIPTGRETWEGVKVVIEQVLKDHRITRADVAAARRAASTRLIRVGDFRSGVAIDQCHDRRYACKQWVRKDGNVCDTAKMFMRLQCPLSCKFCVPAT